MKDEDLREPAEDAGLTWGFPRLAGFPEHRDGHRPPSPTFSGFPTFSGPPPFSPRSLKARDREHPIVIWKGH